MDTVVQDGPTALASSLGVQVGIGEDTFVDDELSNEEMDLVCGVYKLLVPQSNPCT